MTWTAVAGVLMMMMTFNREVAGLKFIGKEK